mmetsp:Transcript_30574/g.98538  ORF Transcript_30574/g.98538 Transcript_30574/m.98538 type:complete len:376 (-) Transcript_30574:46-1173(-)
MIEPALWAMERASRRGVFDYFINLSGDSWPVLTQGSLRKVLRSLAPLSFVASAPQSPTGLRPTARHEFGDGWHKKQAYPSPMVAEVPALEAHYGSQWMIAHRSFVDLVLSQLENDDENHRTAAALLRDWFKFATIHVEGVGKVRPHIPDETFFPSLLMYYYGSPFGDGLQSDGDASPKVPLPVEVYERCDDSNGDDDDDKKGRKVRLLRTAFYIRMDEHYPWSSSKQRYVAPTLDKKARPWGPYYLGAYDLKEIRDFGALFVRKVSDDVDSTLFHVLPVDDHDDIPPIGWPPHNQLALSKTDPRFETLTRGKDKGCIRVAESIHCPPNHTLHADVADTEAAVADLLLREREREKKRRPSAAPPTAYHHEEDDTEL